MTKICVLWRRLVLPYKIWVVHSTLTAIDSTSASPQSVLLSVLFAALYLDDKMVKEMAAKGDAATDEDVNMIVEAISAVIRPCIPSIMTIGLSSLSQKQDGVRLGGLKVLGAVLSHCTSTESGGCPRHWKQCWATEYQSHTDWRGCIVS